MDTRLDAKSGNKGRQQRLAGFGFFPKNCHALTQFHLIVLGYRIWFGRKLHLAQMDASVASINYQVYLGFLVFTVGLLASP